MMELELAGQRTPIPLGELVVGSDPSCGLRLTGVAVSHAVVVGAPDGSVSVRRFGDNDVLLNGVKLGAEPAPALHGDKIQVGIHELLVHDPRRSGSTQFVSASDVAKMVAATGKPGAPKPATAATGGRLVCLTDGREYTIGSAPLVIGREAGCDIVVPNKDVSRRHAEIFSSPQGYVLVDSSINGTFVNADRIEAQRVLARADVIRIGDHEFRFYADRAPDAPPPGGPPSPLAVAPSEPAPAAPPAPASPASGAAERLSHTMHGLPVPTPAAPKPVVRSSGPMAHLANFLVRSGQLKGQRLVVRVPVVNIGRAEYNDLVIPDDSVSSTHAKLQRREGNWILFDNESTNGTWVDGERVSGEAMLGPGSVVRFGEISAMFEPTDDHLGTASGSGTKVMGALRIPGAPPTPAPQPVVSAPPPVAPPPVNTPPAMPAAAVPPAAPPRPAAPEPKPPQAPQPSAPRPQPGSEPALHRSSPRRPPVVVSSPPTPGFPRWLIPAVVMVILGVVAAILLTR